MKQEVRICPEYAEFAVKAKWQATPSVTVTERLPVLGTPTFTRSDTRVLTARLSAATFAPDVCAAERSKELDPFLRNDLISSRLSSDSLFD